MLTKSTICFPMVNCAIPILLRSAREIFSLKLLENGVFRLDTTIAERVFLFSLQISNHDSFAIPIITVIISFTLIQRLCIAWLAFFLHHVCFPFWCCVVRGVREFVPLQFICLLPPKKPENKTKDQKKKS